MSFSSVTIQGKQATPDRVYYNGTVVNNSLTSIQLVDDPAITFKDQRQTALIVDAHNYEISVMNFSLNGCPKTLPLFIPQIGATSPSDINTTIYSITFGVQHGSTYDVVTKYVIWRPENQASYTLVPTTALPIQKETDYYYCYTYSHFICQVNAALNAAWVEAGGGGNPAFYAFGTQCPFFEFDEVTGLFSLNQDSNTCLTPYDTTLPSPYATATYTTASNPAGADYASGEYSFVGMNSCLENLLTNFAATYYSADQLWAAQPGKYLPEIVIDTGLPIDLKTETADTDTPVGLTLRSNPKSSIFQLVNPFNGAAIQKAFFARLTQDYISTGGCWSPIASFVLATNKIPVRNEANANPVTFGSSNLAGIPSSGAFQKVLIETPIQALRADIWKGNILYEPSLELFASLEPSHEGISEVDITLFWRNRLTNSLVPVHIPNQGSMSFRLLFKRK